MILFRNVSVVDGSQDDARPNQDVVVDGERIASVEPTDSDRDWPEDAIVVDGTARPPARPHRLPRALHRRRDPRTRRGGRALAAAGNARRALEAGVTTARSGGSRSGLDLVLRDAIAAGDVRGPRTPRRRAGTARSAGGTAANRARGRRTRCVRGCGPGQRAGRRRRHQDRGGRPYCAAGDFALRVDVEGRDRGRRRRGVPARSTGHEPRRDHGRASSSRSGPGSRASSTATTRESRRRRSWPAAAPSSCRRSSRWTPRATAATTRRSAPIGRRLPT